MYCNLLLIGIPYGMVILRNCNNLINGKDLPIALLNLLQLSQEVSELGFGPNLIDGPKLHPVNLRVLIVSVGRAFQQPGTGETAEGRTSKGQNKEPAEGRDEGKEAAESRDKGVRVWLKK